MLHESPNCMGIAWERDNVYWVFDGSSGAIVRYDFQEDHGVGWDDHSDGIIGRWVEGEVRRVGGVVSHLELDRASGLLYIADTGNNRIAVLDTNSGRRGEDLVATEPGTDHHAWKDGALTTLVDGDALGMSAPAGLALVDGTLFVTDAGTGRLHAFDLDGTELDWAETGRDGGALAGIVATSTSELWVVDADADEVLRLRP
jgi:sugar lactone lactonase YvrE